MEYRIQRLDDNNGMVDIRFVATSGINATFSGITSSNPIVENDIITVGEDVSIGDVLYLGTNGQYYKATNSSESTSSTELRIANDIILSGNTGSALISGQFTTSGLTQGDKYWVGTNGGYTNIQPTGNGNIVRNIGVALDTNTLEFRPDKTYVEVSSTSGEGTQPSIRTVTGNTTILNTDYTINVGVTADTTQTLPLSVSLTGKIYNIKNSDSTGTSTITIATTSGELIDNLYGGGNDLQIIFPQSIKLQSTGSGWIII